MQFSIIYEADIPMRLSVKTVQPPFIKRWRLTEQGDGEPSDWCSELWDGKVKHRKWCAILDKDQTLEFCRTTGVYPESTETMGSLGALGFGFGWAPAIAFTNDDSDSIQNAYVTPMPCKRNGEPIRANGDTERDWKRIKSAVLNFFD